MAAENVKIEHELELKKLEIDQKRERRTFEKERIEFEREKKCTRYRT